MPWTSVSWDDIWAVNWSIFHIAIWQRVLTVLTVDSGAGILIAWDSAVMAIDCWCWTHLDVWWPLFVIWERPLLGWGGIVPLALILAVIPRWWQGPFLVYRCSLLGRVDSMICSLWLSLCLDRWGQVDCLCWDWMLIERLLFVSLSWLMIFVHSRLVAFRNGTSVWMLVVDLLVRPDWLLSRLWFPWCINDCFSRGRRLGGLLLAGGWFWP